jgi:PIN domain nuclease of toxin-antitoxin system
LLLDAVTLLWMESATEKLSKRARELYENSDHQMYLSSISAYEIVVKARLGRLELGAPPGEFIASVRQKFGIESLPVTEESAFAVERLPPIHTDPFDRLMIAQSIVHAMTIVTPDATVARYPIRVLW